MSRSHARRPRGGPAPQRTGTMYASANVTRQRRIQLAVRGLAALAAAAVIILGGGRLFGMFLYWVLGF